MSFLQMKFITESTFRTLFLTDYRYFSLNLVNYCDFWIHHISLICSCYLRLVTLLNCYQLRKHHCFIKKCGLLNTCIKMLRSISYVSPLLDKVLHLIRRNCFWTFAFHKCCYPFSVLEPTLILNSEYMHQYHCLSYRGHILYLILYT